MGLQWDSFVPPPAVWDECLRVLKPGGHLAAFSAPRTYDLMTLSIRLAGFEIRDQILAWLHGQGFPKSLDVSKAIDKARDDRHAEALTVTVPMAEAMRAKGLTRQDLNRACGLGESGAGSAQSWTTVVADGAHKPRVPTVEQWTILRDLLGLRHLDAEVWRLNGRKGSPGDAWEQREVIGTKRTRLPGGTTFAQDEWSRAARDVGDVDITAPATLAAERWQGWGTALKPAVEPVVLARKPLAEKSVAANVLAHGTGAINVDACRVGTSKSVPASAAVPVTGEHGIYSAGWVAKADRSGMDPNTGRWPANVLLSHSENCHEPGECAPGCPVAELDAQSGIREGGHHPKRGGAVNEVYGKRAGYEGSDLRDEPGGASRYFPVFRHDETGCAPGCPVAELDAQSGILRPGERPAKRTGMGYHDNDRNRSGTSGERQVLDSGGAARFFVSFRYQAKAPARERPKIDGKGWPTVKPVQLMRWLVRLLCPPGGVVLDPFAGTGSTLQAARDEGFASIGIERDEFAYALACQRLDSTAPPPAAPVVEAPALFDLPDEAAS